MKKIFIYLFFCLMAIAARAQVDEVKLVVSGSGNTREDAITSALRGAVEQAFGVFVSSNTTILNDQLVKDEIATISSGNIKSYDVISDITTTNGKSNVTVSAVVSVNNLIQYAEAKGASCEFAGTLFGANLRLLELNKKNTKIAFQHMLDLLKSYSGRMVDYEISVSNPQVDGTVTIEISTIANNNTKVIGEILEKTINSISVDWAESERLKKMGVKMDGGWLPVNYGVAGSFYNSKIDSIYKHYPEDCKKRAGRYIYSYVASREALSKVFEDGILDFDIIAKDYQNSSHKISLEDAYLRYQKYSLIIPRGEFCGENSRGVCASIHFKFDYRTKTQTGRIYGSPFYNRHVDRNSSDCINEPLTFPFACPVGTIISKNSFEVKVPNLATIKSFEIVPGGYKK